jgi:hypothetical protein
MTIQATEMRINQWKLSFDEKLYYNAFHDYWQLKNHKHHVDFCISTTLIYSDDSFCLATIACLVVPFVDEIVQGGMKQKMSCSMNFLFKFLFVSVCMACFFSSQ